MTDAQIEQFVENGYVRIEGHASISERFRFGFRRRTIPAMQAGTSTPASEQRIQTSCRGERT
jgi:hypothetical protein